MIECLVKKDIKTADELCDAVGECKKDLEGLKVGKHHELRGAGGKTIMLVSKGDKEFISYSEVMNQKGHFGKLLYKLFFEEDSEESEVSVEDVFLDIKEKLSHGQIAELSDLLAKANTRRFDFSRMFKKSEDFSSEIGDAKKWYLEIDNQDIIRAFGTMEALDIPFDSDKAKWDIKSYGYRATLMVQDKIGMPSSSGFSLFMLRVAVFAHRHADAGEEELLRVVD